MEKCPKCKNHSLESVWQEWPNNKGHFRNRCLTIGCGYKEEIQQLSDVCWNDDKNRLEIWKGGEYRVST